MNRLSTAFILFFVLNSLACGGAKDDGTIRLSATAEADKVKVAPLIGGRIIKLNLEEGTTVKANDLIAAFDCEELQIQLKQMQANLKGANAQLKMIKTGPRQEDKKNVAALLAQAETAMGNAKKDLDRATQLYKSGSAPKKQFDDASDKYAIASQQYEAVKQQHNKVQNGARPEEIEAAAAAKEQLEAAIELVKKKLTYCEVYAPIGGTALYKYAYVGEVAAPGVPLGVIADLSKMKVAGYVSELDLAVVKLGASAKIFMDGKPDKPIEGKISYIASEAEFTPKNVQTVNERVKTMYKIEISVDNAAGDLKSGMPVDVVIKKQ